jgi:hypothetical protein
MTLANPLNPNICVDCAELMLPDLAVEITQATEPAVTESDEHHASVILVSRCS